MEIERRFIVLDEFFIKHLLNNLLDYKPKHIFQYYSEDLPYRLRRISDKNGVKYYQTIKLGKGLSREEYETELTSLQFSEMFGVVKEELDKIRCTYHRRFEETIYLDIITDVAIKTKSYKGELVIAEIEFKTVEEAELYQFPFKNVEVTETITSSMLAKNMKKTCRTIENLINNLAKI